MVSEATADATLGRQWMEEGYVVVHGIYSADRAQMLRAIGRIDASNDDSTPTEPSVRRMAPCMRNPTGGVMSTRAAPAVRVELLIARSLVQRTQLFAPSLRRWDPHRSATGDRTQP